MGCGGSKTSVKHISSPASIMKERVEDMRSGSLGEDSGIDTSAASSADKNGRGHAQHGGHGNQGVGQVGRLAAAVAVADLGDSLDSRHLTEPTLSSESTSSPLMSESGPVITEESAASLVAEVEAAFRPVQLPELLVITGRACARTLSGYQKGKREEQRILNDLRNEGLLTRSKAKTTGGVSFEVIDANKGDDEPQQRVPKKKLERMEMRRETIRKSTARQSDRLAEAELRRRETEEKRVRSITERTGLERHQKNRSDALDDKRNKYSATVAKRQQQLQEMRDRLKDKHKKNEMVRLKQQLLGNSNNSFDLSGSFATRQDAFFDD